MSAFFRSLPAAALIFFSAGGICADDFATQCKELSQNVKVNVTFQDRAVVTDESRNVEALNGLFSKRADRQHNVYGLTHAEPEFRVNVMVQTVVNKQGQICAMPNISLTLGFSEMTVYLARELTGECRRNLVREHEDEHVNTWKSQMRASAQLLRTILQREIGEARIYDSRAEAEAGVRAWADELVSPWVKRMLVTVRDAQEVIDTPVSYAALTRRLRSCPPAPR